jgi:cellulose synthase/poly-beta-1,6-N-acetylglucosamine synthase-like glycosyltransferase
VSSKQNSEGCRFPVCWVLSRLRSLAWLLSLFTIIWPTVLYPLTLVALSRRFGKRIAARSGYAPSVTIIVPTYNEASLIRRRLADIAAYEYDLDKVEVIVVDSGSSDGTSDVVETVHREGLLPRLVLIREERRRGKAAAINLALRQASGEIMVITDAPTLFHPQALGRLASDFADPSVGAVTGDFRIPDQSTLSQREEGLFWTLRNRLRRLEANLDSTPFLSGEMCCFRRRLVDWVDEDSMADDMNIALQVRQAGYRVIVDPVASFSEPRSASFRELDASKTRRAVGGIQELFRFRHMMFQRHYGWFGILILPSALLYYLPLRPLALAFLGNEMLRPLGKRRPSPRSAIAIAAGVLGFRRAARSPAARRAMLVTLFNEWIFLRGFVSWVSGRYSVTWAQERSTRRPMDNSAAPGDSEVSDSGQGQADEWAL